MTAMMPDEGLLRSTIDALSAHIAMLDESGRIIAVNEAWRRFGREAGLSDTAHGVGTNYLEVCERAAAEAPSAAAAAQGLRAIMAGERREFRMEYPCTGPSGTRWFQLRVTRPLDTQEDRLVVAHEDITEIKRAEEELAQLSARLLTVQDQERRRIARELHDSTAQNLLAVILNLTRLGEHVRRLRPEVRRTVADSIGLAEQSLQEIRTLSYLLHPPLLDEIGLASALRWYAQGFAERSGIRVDLEVEDRAERLPADVETALFRMVFLNAIKDTPHAGERPSGRVSKHARSRCNLFPTALAASCPASPYRVAGPSAAASSGHVL
jgi:two-component system NarL family sensor kinase